MDINIAFILNEECITFVRGFVYYYWVGKGGERLDRAIIEKAKQGNDHAFRIIVENYQHDIFRTIYAILRNEKDAEDAVQEVFLKIYLSLPRYQNEGFKTWITRIAVNHAIDMKRKAHRKREEMTEDIQEAERRHASAVHEDTIEGQLINKEFRHLVHERLHEIPENYREVIYGYYIEEKTYQQLAEEQNVRKATIATKLHRARLWMKKHWKEDDFK